MIPATDARVRVRLVGWGHDRDSPLARPDRAARGAPGRVRPCRELVARVCDVPRAGLAAGRLGSVRKLGERVDAADCVPRGDRPPWVAVGGSAGRGELRPARAGVRGGGRRRRPVLQPGAVRPDRARGRPVRRGRSRVAAGRRPRGGCGDCAAGRDRVGRGGLRDHRGERDDGPDVLGRGGGVRSCSWAGWCWVACGAARTASLPSSAPS